MDKDLFEQAGVDKDAKVEFVAMRKDELKSIIWEAAMAGASLATEELEKSHKKEQKEQKDRRLHNTKLLLRNYRMLKENCEKAVYSRQREQSAAEIMDSIMSMKDDRVIVESIKRTAERTGIILAHIDKMLDIYRMYCGKYTDREKRQYKVIKALYISKQKKSVKDLAEEFGVSKVTIYEDIKIAEERLSALFFGINGLKFFQ